MRTLITFATLSACPITIALALLLVGGCAEKQEVIEGFEVDSRESPALMSTARLDSMLSHDPCPPLEDIQKMQFDSDTTVIPIPKQPLPCPPCPETLFVFVDTVFIEPTKIIDADSVVIRYKVLSSKSFYRMPPGRWYKSCNLGFLGAGEPDSMTVWPDSVFILSETPEEE